MMHTSARPVPGLVPKKHKSTDPFALFAIEGALLQLFTSINGFSNNLFATEMGATDLQIGLIQTVPNAAALLLLLPLGILADRLKSSRTIPMISLLSVFCGYLLMIAVPSFGALRIPAFFIALAFTVGGPVLYNAQWQTFFGDVVSSEARNQALTLRNRFMFSLGVATPLVCGFFMRGPVNTVHMYQTFFAICAVAVLIQAGVVSGIHPPDHTSQGNKFSMQELVFAVKTLSKTKAFLLFFLPVLFFYATWQMDWSMWYIGQVQYLHLTESEMTTYNGIFNIGQLIAIGILAKAVQKRGTDRALPFAALGLCSCPLIMIVCSFIPEGHRIVPFTLLMTVLNAPQCATNLCIVQILLRVVPQQCRGIAVSLYTLVITLSNCIMPYMGVKLYGALGSDYRALIFFCLTVFFARLIAFALLVWRSKFAE